MTSGDLPSEPAEVLDLFAEEAAEHVAGLRSGLEALSLAPTPQQTTTLLEALRRNAHGIVGSAWAVGVNPAAELMQAVERSSYELAESGAVPSAHYLGAVTSAVDATETVIGDAVRGQLPPREIDVAALVAALASATPG